MRASSATSWRGLSSGRAGAMGFTGAPPSAAARERGALLSDSLAFARSFRTLLSGRELGALDVDRDAGDAPVVGQVEDQGLRRIGAVDALGELGRRHSAGVDDP